MTSHISPSIIMRIREFGESDLLVTYLTSDRGLLKGVAKGARRSRRRFSNCLDLFCLSTLEYEDNKRGDLTFLHSCKLIDAFPGLRSDFSSLSLASYMVELAQILFPPGVQDRRVFDLLKEAFHRLDRGGRANTLRILFEGKILSLAGYGINFDCCCDCGRPYAGEGRAVFIQSKGGIGCMKCEKECTLAPGLEPRSVKVLKMVQSAPWGEVESLELSESVAREIKRVLECHLEYRIGRELKTAKYLD